MESTRTFSKERWLVSALGDKDRGILTQNDIDNACAVWVDDLDGKTVAQLEAEGKDIGLTNREEWFV